MSRGVVHLELADGAARRAWAPVARTSALVTAAFSLLVSVVMAGSIMRDYVETPLSTTRLPALKQRLIDRPDDEKVKEEIRGIDANLRRAHFERRAFLRHGAWLLLGGVLACAVAYKTAAALEATPFIPDANRPRGDDGPIVRRWSRRAVLIGAGAIGLTLVMLPRGERWGEVGEEKPEPANVAIAPATTNAALAVADAPKDEDVQRNWPAFRGPAGTGLAAGDAYPAEWDGASGKNIAWRTAIPLPGRNAPIVWDDKVFLSGASAEQREVFCFDAKTGSLVWRQPVGKGGEPVKILPDTSFAPSTLATDGRRVIAIFPTSDLACLDTATGKPIWAKNLGLPENPYGHAISLVLSRGRIFVQYDQGGEDDAHKKKSKSVLYAIDAATGAVAWEAKRPDVPVSWATPLVVGPEIVTAANPWVIAYDVATGKETWRAKVMGGEVAPSPTTDGDMVYVGVENADMVGIRLGGKGDVTKTHVAWKISDNLPDIVSPLAHAGLLWLAQTHGGSIACFDTKTGKIVWDHTFEDATFNCSPVIAAGRIYLTDNAGVTYLFAPGREFKDLGKAALGEEVAASPAFAGGRIYVRGKSNLYCIGGTKP